MAAEAIRLSTKMPMTEIPTRPKWLFGAPTPAQTALRLQPVAHETEDLDPARQQGHQHRDERDGAVVAEFSQGLDERPPVGAGHPHPTGGVDEGHPGGEKGGEDEFRPDADPGRCLPCADPERRDLRGGVESEAEEKTDQVHLPAPADQVISSGPLPSVL